MGFGYYQLITVIISTNYTYPEQDGSLVDMSISEPLLHYSELTETTKLTKLTELPELAKLTWHSPLCYLYFSWKLPNSKICSFCCPENFRPQWKALVVSCHSQLIFGMISLAHSALRHFIAACYAYL